jgi:O-antigen/teichoic acid export membrane protein
LIAVAAMAGLAAWDLLESIAFGHQRMGFSAVLSAVGALAWLIWAWSVPEAWLTPVSVSIAFAAVQLAKVLAYAMLERQAGSFSGSRHRVHWKQEILQPALPFYWLAIVAALTSQVPILFLAEHAGQAEVGLYNVGFRVVTPLQMLLVTAFTALYPGLSRTASSASPRFGQLVRDALIGTVALGTAGAILISSVRHEVVLLLFGPAYVAAAEPVAALSWYSVLLAISSLIGCG